MKTDLAFIYDNTKNPDGVHLDGVPLRDLTRVEFEALPEKWKTAVIQQPFYVAVKPATKKEGD